MPKTTSKSQNKSSKSNNPSSRSRKGRKQMKQRSTVRASLKPFVFRFNKPSRRIGTGGVMPKSRNLGRLIRWPKYVKLQRQRKILLQRLVIPPAINIFYQSASKPLAKNIITFLNKYKPENRRQKRDRQRAQANLQSEQKVPETQKPIMVKCGFNHVTNLIERGEAKLVCIAHDVDPIELVLWMPTLCVKRDVPFAIIKSKSRLGTVVNKKTAACVALCEVNTEDQEDFNKLCNEVKKNFNLRFNAMKKKWSGKLLGIKTRHKIEKRQRARRLEQKRRREAQEKSKKSAALQQQRTQTKSKKPKQQRQPKQRN